MTHDTEEQNEQDDDGLKLGLSMMYDEQDGQLHIADVPGSLDGAFELLSQCQFHFSSLADIRQINGVLGQFFDKDKKIITGINALMINALEHGILGVGYETKAELISTGQWAEEIEQRSAATEHEGKQADIIITNKDDGTYIIVNDPGPGFAWQNYLKIDPVRAGRKHGRGIALANALSFDKLSYNDSGNQAIAFISRSEKIQW